MPEGPEIRIEADAIAAVLEGQKIKQAYFYHPQPDQYRAQILGKQVKVVRALGKAMVINVAGGLSIYSHNQLYGKWIVSESSEPPESHRSLRMALITKSGAACLFSASEIKVMKTEDVEAHPYVAKLGPDCLDECVTWQAVRDRLRSPPFARRALAATLLDQKFMAGLGNYLRSDVLHVAGVHPETAVVEIPGLAMERLARAILTLPRRSYKSQGFTRPVGQARRDMRAGASFEQARFWAYGREGLPCRQCDAIIERVDLTGRGVYFCPQCQVLPGS